MILYVLLQSHNLDYTFKGGVLANKPEDTNKLSSIRWPLLIFSRTVLHFRLLVS